MAYGETNLLKQSML